MNKMVLDHNSYTPEGGVRSGGGKSPSPSGGGGGAPPTTQKEVRVYYSGESSGRLKRRTKLEKYLLVLCFLLFVASVAFLIIALTRDSKGERTHSLLRSLTHLCSCGSRNEVRGGGALTLGGPNSHLEDILLQNWEGTDFSGDQSPILSGGVWSHQRRIEINLSFRKFMKVVGRMKPGPQNEAKDM